MLRALQSGRRVWLRARVARRRSKRCCKLRTRCRSISSSRACRRCTSMRCVPWIIPVRAQAAVELEQHALAFSDRLDEVDSAIGKLVVNLAEANPQSSRARAGSFFVVQALGAAAVALRESHHVRGALRSIAQYRRAGSGPRLGSARPGRRADRAHQRCRPGAIRTGDARAARSAGRQRPSRRFARRCDHDGDADSLGGLRVQRRDHRAHRPRTAERASRGRALTTGCGTRYDVTVVAALVGLTNGM